MKNVTIIVPVYQGIQPTQHCLNAVIPHLSPWVQLLVINDNSPEPQLTAWLQQHAAQHQYTLLEHSHTLGLVATINQGITFAQTDDILLLNNRVEVPHSDWLSRLRNAAYSKDNLASITPFSNNGTICSFPHFCHDNTLFNHCTVTELDTAFAALPLPEILIEIPTAVKCCMYLTRACLDAIGDFDAASFDQGYGEENDWCQRAITAGWKNYHQLNVFVYHHDEEEEEEEEEEEKVTPESTDRKAKALTAIKARYPHYHNDLNVFVATDPAKEARELALLAVLKNSHKKKILLISHCMGGGVKQHLDDLSRLYHEQVDYFTLAPANHGNSVSLCYVSSFKQQYLFDVNHDIDALIQLLSFIDFDRIHFHHTLELPLPLYQLPQTLALPYDITIHDYDLISDNPTFTDRNGIFIGDDKITTKDLKETQPLLAGASRIIFPSLDCATRFCRFVDGISDKVVVNYHPEMVPAPHHCDEKQPRQKGKQATPNKPKVLVLGALTQHKGADLFEAVAIKSAIECHLAGHSYRPLKGVITHGHYTLDTIDRIIQDIAPDYIWFPAQWPETYSYTLSIALRHSSIIVLPNLGAFPERVCDREESLILPWNMPVTDCIAFWDLISSGGDHRRYTITKTPTVSTFTRQTEFYRQQYLNFPQKTRYLSPITPAIFSITGYKAKPNNATASIKEQLLLRLWKIRHNALFSSLLNCVPSEVKQKVIKKLSARPLHELIVNTKNIALDGLSVGYGFMSMVEYIVL